MKTNYFYTPYRIYLIAIIQYRKAFLEYTIPIFLPVKIFSFLERKSIYSQYRCDDLAFKGLNREIYPHQINILLRAVGSESVFQ